MYTITVGADPRVRPVYIHTGGHVIGHAGGLPGGLPGGCKTRPYIYVNIYRLRYATFTYRNQGRGAKLSSMMSVITSFMSIPAARTC